MVERYGKANKKWKYRNRESKICQGHAPRDLILLIMPSYDFMRGSSFIKLGSNGVMVSGNTLDTPKGVLH